MRGLCRRLEGRIVWFTGGSLTVWKTKWVGENPTGLAPTFPTKAAGYTTNPWAGYMHTPGQRTTFGFGQRNIVGSGQNRESTHFYIVITLPIGSTF